MSDEEIIARAIWQSAFPNEPIQPGKVYDVCLEQGVASVAALREAGRLVPDNAVLVSGELWRRSVLIDTDRWERLTTFATAAAKYLQIPTDGPLTIEWSNRETGEHVTMSIQSSDFATR